MLRKLVVASLVLLMCIPAVLVSMSQNPVVTGQDSSVRASYGEITIPTYPWQGADDINPYFRWTSPGGYSPTLTIYPYPMQDNLSKTKSDRKYKTLVLENEYLKVTVIPELGGHVHAVLDKITGENMLYENKVIKPSLIGLRGAWGSGGIEFNTGPQGHTVTCLSPVEAKFVDYGDGSKAIAIGNVEQVYHTQWVVTVRLRPGRSFLEEHIRMFNPTGNRHTYYFWNCVAMPNTKGTQFIYPMTLGTDHGGTTFFTWPVNGGKDISWLKNYDMPASVFSYRCDQDFYGSYDHDLDRGVIVYANHHELSGKKSWTWSMGNWGRRAQASLTDDGTFYNEIQTGPLPTQADYGVLDSHQTVEWDEWWYPVRGTKGVVYSNKNVSANILKDDAKKTLTVLLHGTGAWDATCTVKDLGSQPVKITADKAVSVTFPMKDHTGPLHISVSEKGGILCEFTYPLTIPVRTPPENPRALPSEDTAAGCWLRGVHHDKEGGTYLAREWYTKAIQKDPNFSPAYTALGEIELDAGQYEEARKHLEKSRKLNLDDGMAAYYLAQVYLEQGLVEDALETAHLAIRRAESAGMAYALAGAIRVRKGEFARSIDPLRKALGYNPGDLVSRNLLAFALWKTGDSESAARELKEVQTRDALDMPSAAIAGLMGKEDKEFTARVAGHFEEVMDLTDFFVTAGLNAEAAQVIVRYYLDPKIAGREVNPLPHYYHGILANDSKSLEHAATLSPDYVFPNRRSDFAILEEVIRRAPKDWKARLYLGNLYYERIRKEDAIKMWNSALDINDSYSVVHRNLGLVAWKLDKDPWRAITHYEKANKCNPNDITLYRDLGKLYIETSQHQAARDLLEVGSKKRTRADITYLLTSTYLNLGQNQKALDLLASDSFINWEGQGGLYDLYTQAHIALGEEFFKKGDYDAALKEFQRSLESPVNLGPGRMDNPPDAETQYWIGMTLEKLGKKAEARQAWERAAAQAGNGGDRNRKFARQSRERLEGNQ